MLTVIQDESLAYSLGAAEYLTKPLDRNLLVSTISELCKLRGAAR
jgi:DNA-binding response OmpR family regulator